MVNCDIYTELIIGLDVLKCRDQIHSLFEDLPCNILMLVFSTTNPKIVFCRMFSIRRKGTVNICYDIVVVPNKATDNKGEFLVELR